jgi:putative transposase
MPRRPRLQLAGVPFHVIQRGNNRSACFFADDDYSFFLDHLSLLSKKHQVAVHAYALMTNHVHLLLTPQRSTGVSALMKQLGQRYVQYVNRVYRRSGSLWEGRLRSSMVDAENYLLACQRYIELNPVRAGMVEHPADSRWSSYRTNGQGQTSDLVQPHPLYRALGGEPASRQAAYRELFRHQLDPAWWTKSARPPTLDSRSATSDFEKRSRSPWAADRHPDNPEGRRSG